MSQGPARAENHTHKTVVHANHFRWSWLRGSYNDTVSKDHIGTISIIFQGVTRFSLAVGTRYLRPKLYTGLFRGEGPTAILCPAVCASSPLPSPSLSPPPPPPPRGRNTQRWFQWILYLEKHSCLTDQIPGFSSRENLFMQMDSYLTLSYYGKIDAFCCRRDRNVAQ